MQKLKNELYRLGKKLTRQLGRGTLARYGATPITRELLAAIARQLFEFRRKPVAENTPTARQVIEAATRDFALARQRLHALTVELHEEIERLKNCRHAAIQSATDECAEREATLHTLLTAAPELFTRPRTATIHGIKVGWQKGKGGIEFDDPARVVALIHRHYPGEEGAALLHLTERPDKEALAKLSVAELRKLGCSVTETGDHVVIRPLNADMPKCRRTGEAGLEAGEGMVTSYL
jgi:hypothetical protein